MSQYGRELDGAYKGLENTGFELDRKYWVALTLYAVLAAVAWFAVGEGKVLVEGRPVEIRLLPLIVLGGFALKTVLARHADRIRRSREEGSKAGNGE
jgi:hypothetical protein